MIQRLVERFRGAELHHTSMWAEALGTIERCAPRHRRALTAAILGSVDPAHRETFLTLMGGQLGYSWTPVSIELTELDLQRAFSQLFGLSLQEVSIRAIQIGGYDELAGLISHPTPAPGMSLDAVLRLLQDIQAWRVEPLDGLITLLRMVEPSALRYIIRLLLGVPPLKLDVSFLLDALAAASHLEQQLIRECYALNGDLAETGARALKGRRTLSQVHSRTGRPYSFSAYPRARSLELALKGLDDAWEVEPEPAGIRVQIHRRHAAFQIFTPRLQEVSRVFPEILTTLEQHLSDTEDLICEGYLLMPSLPRDEAMRTLEARIMQLPLARGAKAEPDDRCVLMVTELVRHGREELLMRPFVERRNRIRAMVGSTSPILVPPPSGKVPISQARAWLESLESPPQGLFMHDPSAPMRLGREAAAVNVPLRELSLNVVALSATLNAQGLPTRVQLGCMHEDQPCHVGEVTIGNTDRAIWQLLVERMRPRIILRRPERWILRPELVLEVTCRGLRSSPRRAAHLSLDRTTLTIIREDLGLSSIHTRLQLEALLTDYRMSLSGPSSFATEDGSLMEESDDPVGITPMRSSLNASLEAEA